MIRRKTVRPGFMNCTEAVTQQVFGVQPLDVLQFFWQMAFWGVITKNMLDGEPYLSGTEKDAALQVMKNVQLAVRVCFLGKNLPDIAKDSSVPDKENKSRKKKSTNGLQPDTHLIAAKSACTGFSMAA